MDRFWRGARAEVGSFGMGAHRRRSGIAIGTAGAAVALALLVICSPNAMAGVTHSSGTFVPPFVGVTDNSGSASVSGCGHAALVTSPTFNLSTGVGKGAVSSSVPSCGPNLNGNDGAGSEQIGLSSNNFTTTTALHHMTAKWSLHWTFTIKTTDPTGRGTVEAIGTVSISLLVFDATNTTVVNETSWYAQHIEAGNSTLSTTGGANHTLTMSAHLLAGHVYFVYVYAYIFSYAYINASPGGTASAKVDLSSGSNKATLHSYSFT